MQHWDRKYWKFVFLVPWATTSMDLNDALTQTLLSDSVAANDRFKSIVMDGDVMNHVSMCGDTYVELQATASLLQQAE